VNRAYFAFVSRFVMTAASREDERDWLIRLGSWRQRKSKRIDTLS
jgi:hypothetical protein